MCGIVLHVSLSGELTQGLNNMKYSINHHWKFNNYKIAFLCGFMQAFNVFIVEFVNFTALLTNFTIIDIIMNFLALVVIAEFDEYFFAAVKSDPLADIITGEGAYENFLIIQRTTSSQARWILDKNNKEINKLEPQKCEEQFVDKERFDMKVLMESKRITKVDARLITEIGE